MADVTQQLEQARRNLLDMTLRNKLLSFKEYKRSTVTVVDEVPAQVYDILVFDEQEMTFTPTECDVSEELDTLTPDQAFETPGEGAYHCKLCQDTESTFTDRDAIQDHLETEHQSTVDFDEGKEAGPTDLWELPELDAEQQDVHTDRELQTPHNESNLQKRLFNIQNRAEALIEDAGYNALHLAIGFLEWTEAQAHEDPNRAPLILVPVSLERKGAQSAFKISWTEAEVTGNLSLELKLSEQDFDLPELERPESKGDIRGYLQAVGDAVQDIDDWKVKPDIHLGFFDYTKFVMYQDLDPEGWEEGHSPADHDLVRALLDPDATTEEPEPFAAEEVDEELAPEDVHHVLDADPSQIAAIEDVKRGRNMVIEGPPGTGKSQTIVNMIAELLAEENTVLFVSEKLAALEVVKERLDTANIGDFALELHSDKASKSEFLDELERLAKVGEFDADIPDRSFRELERYREELNAYADALGTPFGELELTPYALIGMKEESLEHFEGKNRSLPRVSIEEATDVSPTARERAHSSLQTLSRHLESVGPVSTHPWRGTHPGQVLPQEREEIIGTIQETLDALHRIQIQKAGLEEEYGLRNADTLEELHQALEAAELLEEDEFIEPDLLRSSDWNQQPKEAEELLELLERMRELEADVGSRLEPERVESDLPELLTKYRRLSSLRTRALRPSWYRLKSRISTLYDDEVPDADEAVQSDLKDRIELRDIRTKINQSEDIGQELFGSLWSGTESDVQRLRRFSKWVVDFRQNIVDNVLREESIDYLAEGHEANTIEEEIASIRNAIGEFQSNYSGLRQALEVDDSQVFGSDLPTAAFGTIEESLEGWESSGHRLDEWSKFDQARETVRESAAGPILTLLGEDVLEPDDLVPCFEGNLADTLLSEAFQQRDALAQFDRNVQQERISNFEELDQQTFDINRKRVLSTLASRTPDMMRGASKSSQAGMLLHEFGKQRMHKPIRILMREAGELIQQLKPCFMMSPLSVAKYLDPETMDFDVVIFDEASQVRPEDALGTIMRGDQVVLFGDTKQLPPTSFFDQVVDQRAGDDQWAFNVQDVESILDLGRSAFPSKRLKWHYRSRHESLIAVSNQEFYDNDLLIYPSPVQNAEDLGLRFHHLPETVYDRGGSSVNREEARAVAQAAVEHYRETPEKSLGVGTFSQAQQEAVREEVERLRKENPEVDEYFTRDADEHFFVKNLERIQGDERDVIYISVGYGYDSNGSFNHNFGPLNNTGGWRRLNVLITRARERCEVFSNFTADAIDASATDARGVKSLKVFLDYAENRNLESLTEVGGDPDSPFERGVIDFLQEQGIEVHPQVGAAGFRIDLAIPDPENPGRYVLGIECDGASYHSSPVARARDRQREAILEDRGWEIYRVWSTDWYRNREQTQQRLLQAVERAIDEGALDPSEPSSEESSPLEETIGDGGGVSIEDIQEDATGVSLEDLAEPYTKARGVPLVPLSNYNVRRSVAAIEKIVKAEGPIHREVLEKRVIENSDVERRGKKVKLTLDKAIKKATRRDKVTQRGEFFYPPSLSNLSIRTRDDDVDDIEWVAEEEIQAAIEEILEYQYATAREDLISQTARVLGFERTGQRITDRVGKVIDEMRSNGRLKRSDGLLETE